MLKHLKQQNFQIIDSYRDTIFAYSNQMSLLASKFKINYSKLVDKINLDTQEILCPNLPRCRWLFYKDPHILNNSLSEQKINYSLVKSARSINEIIHKKYVILYILS